jgi:NTP pyrophosphatase (non-canonical NTP hydrolase)
MDLDTRKLRVDLLERIQVDVDQEMARQLELEREGKFKFAVEHSMSNKEALAILVEEVGECARHINEGVVTHIGLRTELIQVAAVAQAWALNLDTEDELLKGTG